MSSPRPIRHFFAVAPLVVQVLLLLAFASRAAMPPSLDMRSSLRTTDVVELGQLLVDVGVWQVRRLNPQEWVRQLMTPGGACATGMLLLHWRRQLVGDALPWFNGEPAAGQSH
ncbi:hypothetical protein [Myxococcus eversor]|uniref:hypothetical protein n=1 Tax=Myxococcus eversor TaxID=2709661 RepID=UPI0013D28C5F|nr:hypothetical protein [Myxococcus eversor]